MSKCDKRIIAKAERMIALVERRIPLEEMTETELVWLFNFLINGVHMPDGPDGRWIP